MNNLTDSKDLRKSNEIFVGKPTLKGVVFMLANEISQEELLLRDVGIQFWELRRVREENEQLRRENEALNTIKKEYEALKAAL